MKPATDVSNAGEKGEQQGRQRGEMQPKWQAKRWVFAAVPWIDYAVTGFPLHKPGKEVTAVMKTQGEECLQKSAGGRGENVLTF